MSLITSPFHAIKLAPFKPQTVFAHLSEQKRWSWWPFLLQIIGLGFISGLYFGLIDWPWYQQQHIMPALTGMSSSEQQIALEFSTRQNVLTSTLIGIIIGTPIFNACHAFYLSKMTQLDEENIHTFGDWYGLLWWTQLPTLVGVVIGLVLFAIIGMQASPTLVLAPLSLATLFGVDAADPSAQFASAISLLTFWTIWLQYQGVQAWTQLKPMLSSIIVLLPYLLVFGIWGLML